MNPENAPINARLMNNDILFGAIADNIHIKIIGINGIKNVDRRPYLSNQIPANVEPNIDVNDVKLAYHDPE